jgi:hypothetical protein
MSRNTIIVQLSFFSRYAVWEKQSGAKNRMIGYYMRARVRVRVRVCVCE